MSCDWGCGAIRVSSTFALFHNFSKISRTHVALETQALTSSQFFELVCSLPLLEDIDLGVWVIGSDYEHGPVFEPRASPPLAGTLSLSLAAEIGDVTRGLLALSNGIHFRKFVFAWSSEEDYQWAMALVERCSDTLEYVEIDRNGQFLPLP
jgi:hypothetical protein